MSPDELLRVLDDYIAPRLDQISAVFLDPDAKVTLLKRANAREMRARSVAAVLMGVLDPYLDELSRLNDIVRSVDEGLASSKGDRPRGDVYNALMTTLMELGVEVITDDMRNQVGLPARGPDGWTPDELIALETARLDAITRPLAPIVIKTS